MRAKMVAIDALVLGPRNMFDEMPERSEKRYVEMEDKFLWNQRILLWFVNEIEINMGINEIMGGLYSEEKGIGVTWKVHFK